MKYSLLVLCIIVFLCCVVIFVKSQGFITPPPPGPSPEEANGRLYNLYYVPTICMDPYIMAQAELGGGVIIKDRKVLMEKYGPYYIQGNIEIAPSGCLVIMPGTVMYFNPGFGIIVNGTLIARGSYLPNQRITMTKNPNASISLGPNSPWPTDARLVDGNTTKDGRLDLNYNGKWRGVCTNYNNFTAIDLNVTCRHLGFVYGNFTYHSFARNETDYMLYEKPACRGSENSLFECPGAANIRYGARVCDGQQVIGFECVGLRPDLAKDHWRGLEFYNSTVGQILEENLYYNSTLSYLEYLDISYAGLDLYRGDYLRHGMATISASPYVPVMNNITIMYGAYDALNLTDIRGEIHIANSTIAYNRGYGMFVKTAVGRTLVNMTDIQYNWGDGVKMYIANYTINEFNRDYPSEQSFCRTPSVKASNFPIIIHEDLIDPLGIKPEGTMCSKLFDTLATKVLTLHTIIMERDPEASGQFTVRDESSKGPIILQFQINNGTFPQSVTSKTNKLWLQFDYNVPPKPPVGQELTKRCKYLRGCIRFLFELTTNYGPDIELRLYNASVANNTGYGVNIQDVRSKVFVNSSVISDNGYGAGLRIYQGAAEVAINNTRIERNVQCGVNITYSGGYQLFNMSTISDNYGYGVITEYLRLNRTRIELVQKIEVVRSKFVLNKWTAFRIGNYCLGGSYYINESYFGQNKWETIEYLSCNISTTQSTNFSMAFNVFDGNQRHAVLLSPVVNTVGIFTNNTFKNHILGVIRINNGYDFIENRWYTDFEVNYRIYANKFFGNTGRYVVDLRLSQPGPRHRLEFKFNEVINNIIQFPFKYLNPRSSADAVIVASSGNIEVQRNYINNPGSKFDISTHLVDPSVIILVNYNWWATTSHEFVYDRIFDQNDRFNIAEMKYYPLLKNDWLYGFYDTSLDPEFKPNFAKGFRVGGVLESVFETTPYTTYRVDRDIYIDKNAILILNEGTTLAFDPSIGMIVHGLIYAYGSDRGEIKLKLYDDDVIPLANRTIYNSIRLIDGENEYGGRLELNISGEVGTVCNDGWIDQSSAIVCQQLGLVYNPEYGIPNTKVYGTSQKIHLSRVQCDQLDTDIFKCQSDVEGVFHCNHTQDVFIQCQPPTWSGLTIAAIPRFGTTQETRINHLTIERAGLLDYADMSFAPGFRIDYNFYSMSYITVQNCMADGINIKYANPYSRNLIEKIMVANNLGNGILTRSPFLELSHLSLINNNKAGFMYDPMFTEYEALSVRNFIQRNRTLSLTELGDLQIGAREMVFITCTPSLVEEQKDYFVQIRTTDLTYRITVQILDYSPRTEIEKVTFYDSPKSGWQTANFWSVEEDLVDFPIVSRDVYMTIRYTVKGLRSGRLALAVISSGVNENIISRIKVYNATIKNNDIGIFAKHYNNPSNEKMDIFHRAKNEKITFDTLLVENSKHEAMFIPSLTKYHENFIPTFTEMTMPERLGDVTYTVVFAKFINNQKGIVAEHNHVDFANNVWIWNLTYVEITNCQTGGFEIELPRVNDLIERKTHALSFTQSKAYNNVNFVFNVLGYYAFVNISNNNFYENTCLLGLMTIGGMEKDLQLNSNRMENNYCKFGINLDLKSHSEYSKTVNGLLQNNVVINNNYNLVTQSGDNSNIPKTYAIAIRGVQNITVRRNVFQNSGYQYELVAGITSLVLENTVNVRENYWGTTDQYVIKSRTFDFDDWNNFAIADYFPFLSIANPNGDLSNDKVLNVELDLNHLGGRIWKDLTLPVRAAPYVVYTDLTVMPNVKFTIQPGTELQFYPNVGMLVLGQLLATGVQESRIKFRPWQPTSGTVHRKRRLTSDAVTAATIRFTGGKKENEGFLELYNSTSKSWTLMCDNQLNEKTAEVVCRTLGMETVNVDVRFTSLYDFYVYGKPMYFLKEFWYYSYYCKGDEESLDFCMKRINYNIKSCVFAANYTFIRCGLRNLPLPLQYWGNIRFAQPKYEEEIVPFVTDLGRSRLQFVDIDGAGMLHGEKVGAIQTTYVTPFLNNINITRCVFNGLDIIAPRQSIDIQTLNIFNNLGYAINILVLNGDSTMSNLSSFVPLITNTVPYNLYGLVDICRMEKEIIVANRLILFFKYSESSSDCVKIIRGLSTVGAKRVALRFLQFNLYQDDFYRNMIEIFNGNEVSSSSLMVRLIANSSQDMIKTKYSSTKDVLTVHMHASPSYWFYGFIAEVVTEPMSGLTYPDDSTFHNIQSTIMKGNQDGALLYKNVGEITPSLIVNHCWIEGNGVEILNLTSPPVIDIGLQSTKTFVLQNSFVSRNKGGVYISATTPSAATKLRGNITNNVFAFNTNGEVLNITGHHYEKILLFENYIYNNTAGDYRDIVHVQNVVVNFTFNTVINNTGHYIVRLYNTEATEATQEYTKNLFNENNCTALYRATFHVGSGNPKINHNYLVNEECDFELESHPANILSFSASIDAKNNWWGSESIGYVSGKIWDSLDNNSLVEAEFLPVKINNQSLIYGKCAPGWFLDTNRCYKFMGSALPYKEANQFCIVNQGFLAETKDKLEFLKYLLRLTMNVYDENLRVWVNSEVTTGRCSAFEKNYVVEEYDCFNVLHPFICEKDPYILAPGYSIYAAVIGIAAGVFGAAVIIITVLVCLWYIKSRKRKRERFERETTIRTSSNKGSTILTKSTVSILSEGQSKRRLDQISVSSSKYAYSEKSLGASQVSLSGLTDDEIATNDAYTRHKLKKQAEIAKGHQNENSPRYDRHDFKNERQDREQHRRRDHNLEQSIDEPIPYGRTEVRSQLNGGYKNSDESKEDSNEQSDNEDDDIDDDCVKEKFEDSEEDEEIDRKQSFTPVKLKKNVEKELDSIQVKTDGVGFMKKADDTGSVDLSIGGRENARKLSSFSQQDAHRDTPTKSNSRSNILNSNPTPTQPPPLAFNIPAKSSRPVQPPVPTPRPNSLSSSRSEDVQFHNTSHNELNDHYGSRDGLDGPKQARGRKNITVPEEPSRNLSKCREKLSGSEGDLTDMGLKVGIDRLPNKSINDSETDRESPIHNSRENLLPKNIDVRDVFLGNRRAPFSSIPEHRHMPEPDMNISNTSPNANYSNLHTSNYLPRNPGTQTSSSNSAAGYQQHPTNRKYQQSTEYDPPSYGNYSDGYHPDPYQTSQDSYYGNVPSQQLANTGVDYLPRNNLNATPKNVSNSRGDLSRSRGELTHSRDNLAHSRENLARSRENLARSRENLARSRENINRSRQLVLNNTIDSDMRANSIDLDKPSQNKSIETEI